MQGGRAPAEVRRHPAQVDQPTGVAAGDREPGVHDVGAQLQQDSGPQQAVARAPGAGAGEEPREHGQQEHIRERVRERDQPRPRRQRGIGGNRSHQERPRQQPQTRRDDQRVDQAGPVPPAGTAADHDQQRGGQQRIAGEVEPIGRGRERLQVQRIDIDAVDNVAGHEHQQATGQAVPDAPTGGAVQAHPAQDRDHGREPHQVVDDRLGQVRQKQAAGRGRQTSGQVDQPQPPVHPCGRHAYLIGGPRPDLRPGWAGTASPTRPRRCALIALLPEERQVIGGVAPEV
jgi:hypothetical protein